MSALCRIGTSGWVYPHWRGVFYPSNLPSCYTAPFAHHDPDYCTTWLGEYDTEATLAVFLGVAAYPVLSGYLAGWLAVLVLTILGLWTIACWSPRVSLWRGRSFWVTTSQTWR